MISNGAAEQFKQLIKKAQETSKAVAEVTTWGGNNPVRLRLPFSQGIILVC